MTVDVALWLVDLVKAKWDVAVESLRASGTTIPKTIRPLVGKEADRALAAPSLRGGPIVKAYQAAPQSSVSLAWGKYDRDVHTQWSLDVKTGGDACRELVHAAGLVIDRLLQLHRKHPHADWDEVESWNETTTEDYPDYQHRVFTLVLARYGEVLPDAIVDVV